jgi:hypothetical protein
MADKTIYGPVDNDGTDVPLKAVDNLDGTYSLKVQLGTNPTIDIGDVTLLPSTANIGDVDILSIAAGDNNIGNVDLASIAAGETHIGSVGTHAVKITGTVTRPANSTTYHVRDVIGTAITANIALTNIARIVGGTGMIFKVRVACSVNQTLKPALEVWLFDTDPAAVVDHAAFAPTDGEVLTVQAIVPLSTSYVGNAGAGATGNCILISDTTPFSYKCTAASRSLIACLVVTNAYIPVDADVFTLIVDAIQD